MTETPDSTTRCPGTRGDHPSTDSGVEAEVADVAEEIDSATDADELDVTGAGDGERSFPTVDRASKDYVEVTVTVDASEMSERETAVLAALAQQFEETFHELYEKNRDYDWSFLASGSKLAASSGTPFDHPARSQAFGLLTRIADKQERLVENVFGDGDAAVSDDPAVTAMEAANYYQFLAFVLDNPELAASFGTVDDVQ